MTGLLPPAEYVDGVEQAYRMHGEGRYYMDPKGHIVLDQYPGEWEAMPSYIEEPEAAACKWVSIRENNRERFDLPTVFSILIYTHPETGFPLAICDGSYHTVMRTGASAAVSARWMARHDSRVLAIVGAGHMAEGTLETCNEVFPWEDVRVWSRSDETLADFVATQQPKYEGFEIQASTDLEQVVRGVDVLVTVTPARRPIVMNDWIDNGTHIAAVGADKQGDQELDPRILQRARIFVDDIRQCRTDGEINVPLSKGLITETDITGEIGEIISGNKSARTSDSEVTLFDSTGIALQDSATVRLEENHGCRKTTGPPRDVTGRVTVCPPPQPSIFPLPRRASSIRGSWRVPRGRVRNGSTSDQSGQNRYAPRQRRSKTRISTLAIVAAAGTLRRWRRRPAAEEAVGPAEGFGVVAVRESPWAGWREKPSLTSRKKSTSAGTLEPSRNIELAVRDWILSWRRLRRHRKVH